MHESIQITLSHLSEEIDFFLIIFLLIAAVASYVQTVTGFAFGLIMVGAVTGFDLAPIEFTAAVVSFSGLANALIALHGSRQEIRGAQASAVLAGLLPAMLGGMLLLSYLSRNAESQLKLILGITILAGGIFLMLKPSPYNKPSSSLSYILAGVVGGIFGGLFSVPGPPIVYHLYRQPITLLQIKTTLLIIFGSASLARICFVALQDGFDHKTLITSLLTIPLVITGGLLGRFFPPPFSDATMRRSAFLLLSTMGMVLVLTH